MRPDEPVSRIMTEAVVAIECDRPVSEVLDCFFQYPIHHLPVVRSGRLVGMLSSADVMKLQFFAPQGTAGRLDYLNDRLSIEQLMRTPSTPRRWWTKSIASSASSPPPTSCVACCTGRRARES